MNTSLWTDIEPYLDPVSRLLMAPDSGTDNLVLYTAYLIQALQRNGDDVNAATMLMRRSEYMNKCAVAYGLYSRHPADTSENSVDNLIGACYGARATAEAILSRWNRRLACFDVARPNWIGIGVNWYGRFIGLKPYIKAAAGRKVNWFDKLVWSLACIWSTYTSKGASDPLLQSLQNDVMPGCNFAKRIWARKYSVPALYAEYFGSQHPLTKSVA